MVSVMSQNARISLKDEHLTWTANVQVLVVIGKVTETMSPEGGVLLCAMTIVEMAPPVVELGLVRT